MRRERSDEADSQWRTSVTTRIEKIKKTGLDRAVLELASKPQFQIAVLGKAGLRTGKLYYKNEFQRNEITIVLRRAVKKSCQRAGDSLGHSTDPTRTSESNTMELPGTDWQW